MAALQDGRVFGDGSGDERTENKITFEVLLLLPKDYNGSVVYTTYGSKSAGGQTVRNNEDSVSLDEEAEELKDEIRMELVLREKELKERNVI